MQPEDSLAEIETEYPQHLFQKVVNRKIINILLESPGYLELCINMLEVSKCKHQEVPPIGAK